MRSIFTSNRDVLEAKGWIPYWEIAQVIGVHENTVRNWMKTEMDPERKKIVLDAIEEVKQEKLQSTN